MSLLYVPAGTRQKIESNFIFIPTQQPESSESPHGQQLTSNLLPTPSNLGSGRRPLQIGHDLDHDPSRLRPGSDVRRQRVGRVGGVDDHAERAAVGAAAVDAAAADGASATVDGVGDYRIPSQTRNNNYNTNTACH